MLKLTLKNLFARKFRLVLTSIAVVLGVAFMAGTFVLTDTLGNVFDDLFVDTNEGVDAQVRAQEPFKSEGQQQTVTRPPVPEALDAEVTDVEGVDLAQGNVFGYALVFEKTGDDTVQNQAPTFGTAWYPGERVGVGSELIGKDSRPPRRLDEVVLDVKTARDGGYKIGDTVRISFQTAAEQPFKLVGVFQVGGKDDGLAGATLAGFMPARAQELMNRVDQWDYIEVRADEGVSEVEVRDAIHRQLPEMRESLQADGVDTPPLQAITGEQLSEEQANDLKDQLSFFNTFLLVFAIVALFVGAFIIYNTFSITVAQRTRELGLMRALGASGSQVVRSVAVEAFVVGLFSSIVGLVLGIAIVKPLEGLLSAFGVDLPSGTMQILPRTIIVSIIVGTLVTFVSAISPARRAARVPPIAALRDQVITGSSGRRRYIWGTLLTGIGLIALGVGLFGGGEGESAALSVGVAAAMVFIGVAMLSPLLAPFAARVLTWPSQKFKSFIGLLARENASRNPRRTASTAAALMIGLALVSLIAIVGESAKATFASAIDDQTKTDFVISPTNFAPFSPEVANLVRQGFEQEFGSPGTVVEWRFGTAEVNGTAEAIVGTTPSFREVSDVPMSGPFDRDALRAGGVLISSDVAADKQCVEGVEADAEVPVDTPRVSCRVGRSLPMHFPSLTSTIAVPVAGIYTDDKAVGGNSSYIVGFDPATDQWQQRFPEALDAFAFVQKPDGASTKQAERVVKNAAEQIGGVEAENKAEFKDRQLAQFNQILGLVYVLLLFAVIIALIGIVNTLALSIYERTREIGLLRAVGMTRKQLSRMIRGEAVIVAVFGSLLGLVIGVVFGAAIVQALESEGITLTLPVGQLVIFVVLAAVFGLLAGWLPARRAARLDVLHAVNAE